jgi:hypothetical protein
MDGIGEDEGDTIGATGKLAAAHREGRRHRARTDALDDPPRLTRRSHGDWRYADATLVDRADRNTVVAGGGESMIKALARARDCRAPVRLGDRG